MAIVESVSVEKKAAIEIFYDKVREQIRSENELYNQRIIWLITMQAFLFATLGLILQAKYSTSPGLRDAIFYVSFILIPLTGVYVGLACYRMLGQARDNLDALGKLWDVKSVDLADAKEISFYPHPKGLNEPIRKRDLSPVRAAYIPLIFVFVWPIFFIFLILA